MANLDYHLWHQDCGVPFHPSFEGRFGAEVHTQQDWSIIQACSGTAPSNL
jgi:hypothetical protein